MFQKRKMSNLQLSEKKKSLKDLKFREEYAFQTV